MLSTSTRRQVVLAAGIVGLLSAPASSYDRKAAVDYSDRYWGGEPGLPRYNTPTFSVYDNDCANFVSQTVMAGNLRFTNASGEFGQNGTMIRANELGPEFTVNHGAATVVDYDDPDTVPQNLPSGDPIFIMRLLNASRTYWVDAKTHAMLLTDQTPLAFSAHSKNRARYPIENIDDPIFTDFAYAIGFNWLRYFHIPTGPVVKYVALSQVQQGQTKVLREYFYDDDYDPEVKFGEYYAHTYNGLNKVTIGDGVAGQGELKIKVIFDATMNETSLVAAFGKTTPFTDNRFTTVGWSTTHQPLDTWEGRLDVTASVADGPQTITIDGKSADGSYLDSDGNLAYYNPGADTSVKFRVNSNNVPLVSMSAEYDVLFNRLQGTATHIPTTRSLGAIVDISDDVGISQLILPGTLTVMSPSGVNLAQLPAGTKNLIVQISELTSGAAYSFSVTNTNGKITQGSWRIEDLALVVKSAAAAYDPAAQSFSAEIDIDVNSTAGIETVIQFDPTLQTSIEEFGAGPVKISVPAVRPFGVGNYFLSSRDKQGNSAFQSLEVYESFYTYTNEPGLVGGMLEVTGNGSLTVALPFPLNVTPGQAGAIKPGALLVEEGRSDFLGLNFTTAESNVPVPLLDNPPVTTFSLTANGQVLASGGFASGVVVPAANIPVNEAVNFTLTVTAPNGVSAVNCLQSEGTTCLRPLLPVVRAHPSVNVLRYTMPLPQQGPHIPIFPGSNQTISLGNGAVLTGFNATSFGLIPKAGFSHGFVEGGNVNLLGDQIYEIQTGTSSAEAYYEPSFTLSLTFDPTKRTNGKKVSLARLDPCELTLFEAIAPDGASVATAPVTGFGRYAIVESKFGTAFEKKFGPCRFVSGDATVTAEESASGPQMNQAINVFGSLGLKSVGTTCDLGPTGTNFTPAGEVKVCYAPEDLAKASVTDDELLIYQFNKAGVRERLPDIFIDRARGMVVGSVSRFSSQFGAFAPAPAVPAMDLLPPLTTLSLDGSALAEASSFVMTTTSTLSLQAADPPFPGAPVSGVAATFILLDSPFVDTTSTPGAPYGGPFTLSEGPHSFAYYSADAAGNVETPRVVNVLAIPPPSVVGVRAIALGAADRFWTVTKEGETAAIARTDETGVAIASVSLSQGLPDSQWGVLLDGAGGAYAIGAAAVGTSGATDLAIYRASPDGLSLASSRIEDGGLGGSDLVFDVAAPGWIAGAIQLSGDVFTSALWRLNPADGTVALSTDFARGAALGVAVDADGSVWTAGYVESSSPRSSRTLDLGLWHFAPDGRTLLGGPFRREAYAADFTPASSARISISSAAVTVSAPRGRPGGGTDLGTVRFDKASGAVLAESAWRAADGSSAYAAALLPDGEGVLAAGGLEAGDTRAALWRYGADGGLASSSLAGASGARGAVFRGAELWLGADGAAVPHKVTSEAALSGALADVRPPRVELVLGGPSFIGPGGAVFIASTTALTFSASDDKLSSGDGLGAGPIAVRYRGDSNGAFALFTSSFGFASEGAHSVEFYGVDAADNPGPVLSRSLAADLTPPVTQLSQNGAVITLTAADADGAGVEGIRYLVDYGNPEVCDNVAENPAAAPGTCENPWYAGPFTLTGGPHTVAFQAADRVGNVEVLRFAYPEVISSGLSSGGAGIGRDPSDTLWTVAAENTTLSFARLSPDGALLASASLPDAVFGFPWSVFFDAAGRSYAIGIADGPGTQAGDAAVYKASPAGDAIEARVVFDSGYANNDIVLDAKAPGWLVGAAQTSGPADFDAAGARDFAMALWKFDPALGSIQLSTSSARASFDIGAGVAVDADGSLWISGYSLRPDAPAAFGFDLALWHYAADGRTRLGGPFLWPGYLSDFDGSITARIHVTAAAVYVAAPRANAAGGTDTAFLRFDKATSRTTAESVWRAGDGSTSYPVAILPETSGLLIAGGIGANVTQAALWRFGYDGAFQGAATADAGGAQGAVFKGSELWLSVDGSTIPYRVLSEAPAAGALIDISTPTAPGLTSISVTPAAASILAGATAQFSAAGTFTDGSTRTLTGEVAWSTDASTVATVDAAGLATGVGGGTARVLASLGALSGQATLTVTVPAPPALTVTSIAPASAATGSSFAAALLGTGFDASAALSLERTSVAQGTWTATGSFTQGRFLGTLTKLRDGRVLLAGGMLEGSATGLSAADLYDPATGSWTAAAPLRQGRNQHAAALLADGRVLVSGGRAGSAFIKTVEIYDPALNTWTTVAPMAQIRQAHELATLPDGRVLAAGGSNGSAHVSSAEIYDPATGLWTPAASMSVTRAFGASAVLGDGRIMFSGGNSTTANASVEIYDAQANAWSAAGTMSGGRYNHRIAVLPDGKVLASGGADNTQVLNSADVYDPAANAWTATAPLAARRYVHAMAVVNGAALVIGGQNPSTDLATTEIYDAAANAWRPGPSLLGTRTFPQAVVLDDGRVLVAGGRRSGANLNTAELLGAPSAAIAVTGVTVTDAQHLSGTVDLTGAATGYWDVVVRETGGRTGRLDGGFLVLPGAPTLASIAVTPASASILAGATAQFSAAGTFTDGSTRTLTGEVAWSTDVSSVATVDAAGLATGVGGGTARVLALSGAVTGRAILSVAYVAASTTVVNGSPELTLVSTSPFSVVIVSTEAGEGAVALGSAAAQGMVLVGTVYDVTRQDPGATAKLTWSFDPALVDAATLAIWRFDGISWSSVTVLNQVVSVAGGVGTVTGDVVLTSLYGLFLRDAAAPVTTLLVDGLPAGAGSLSLAPASAIGFTAADAGVGVRETRYVLDGGEEAVFAAPFSLPPGAHSLSYRSVDRAGNEEEARAVAISVTNPSADLEPPLVRLEFPGPSAPGVEGAVGGVVSVRGSASDGSALTWTVKAGAAVLASGTGDISGELASWDTAGLSGPLTLTLSATDAYGNAASTSAQVFVGAPVMTFAVGRKDSNVIVSTLKGPTGIAIRADGAIWVASTENDKILLISPAGALLGEADGAKFKSPQGLALDSAGNLYVADRDLDRVVKLSPDGRTLLRQFGKLDRHGKSKPGSGTGELRNPFDVAVDGNGDVYAADSGNHRIQVFDASGAFLRQFGPGVLLSTSEVRGVALTSEGLWVSDKELDAIHLFSRTGGLIKTIGAADSVVGELSRTRGLAADRLGALYVVEPNRDRAQKFDPRGRGLLAFGGKEGLSKADKAAKRWLTQPLDAAAAPDGSIWFTDTGRDRIVRYALPVAGYGTADYSAGGGAVSPSIEPARRVVDHKDGAKVERDDGAGVRVPKGALAADLEITVDRGDENRDKEHKDAKRREMGVKAVSEEVEYGPEGTTFSAPVTLTLPYDAGRLAALGVKEDDLKVYYWNPGLKDWQAMPSTVDKEGKTVNAQTTHFSAYQIGGLGGVGVAAIDDFGLRGGYAFPNPSRNGAAVAFRMQPGSADSIEVRVYDVSGRKVHSSSDFRFRGAFDDGNGGGPQNTYDHDWDVSGIGSGVYTFVITAKKTGQPDVRKTGKVGVIR